MKEGIYSEDGKACYKAFFLSKNWNAAREFCQKEYKNGDLAAVSDWKIKQTLEKHLKKQESYWIGGHKINGQWEWSNGDTWDFESWGTGQPNLDASKEENFIRMDGAFNWHDYVLNSKSYFLCEWKM